MKFNYPPYKYILDLEKKHYLLNKTIEKAHYKTFIKKE